MFDFLTIAIYVVVWWLVFSMLIPIAGKPSAEPGQGHAPGSPHKAYLKQKVIGASLIAVPITWGLAKLF